MTVTIFILLLLLGMITGFYSGLIGSGGNVIIIPALDILFAHYNISGPESVKFIIANSLFITVFLGLTVSLKQYRIGNFYLREILTIGIPGMISAFLLSELINSSDWYNKFYFDIFFLTLLILLAVRLLFSQPEENSVEKIMSKRKRENIPFISLGIFTGAVTSLSGLGGGVVLIPVLTDIVKTPIRKASSISIGIITLLAIAVSVSYLFVSESTDIVSRLPWQQGYISLAIVLPILVGIFMASAYGVRMAHKISPTRLRIIFGITIAVICMKMVLNFILN